MVTLVYGIGLWSSSHLYALSYQWSDSVLYEGLTLPLFAPPLLSLICIGFKGSISSCGSSLQVWLLVIVVLLLLVISSCIGF